jgi:hypothetical protein
MPEQQTDGGTNSAQSDGANTDSQQQGDQQQQNQQQGDQQQQDTTDWKAEARKWEQRSKEHGGRAKELEKRLQANMSDAEKALAEAEERGRTTATQTLGTRLVRTEFDAQAARRNPAFETKDVLEYVDLSKMVGEDGEPDAKAIGAAVQRLVPEPTDGAPSFEGGTRTPPPKGNAFGEQLRQEIQGRR